ncbi:MAG: Cof-type HAD-IIB family hydrolase [Pelosinus sp.]|nr:Cof-type HAD-IIB family hydrolase [Pelosinus sp.]
MGKDMTYKLVCVDVDGTLLNSRRVVAESTKQSLKMAHDKGVHIVISTGRMYTDAQFYSSLLGVRSAVIASNGAFIQENNNVIYKSVLGAEVLQKLLRVFSKYRIKPCFSTPEKFYYGYLLFKLFYLIAKLRRIRSDKIKTEYLFSWQRCRKVVDQEKDNIVKCEIFHSNTDLLAKLRNELKNIPELEIVNSGLRNIEITRHGVSKGRAVAMLAKVYGISKEEIMTIGDSQNDLSMIEYAGLGVAMGNASEEVKERADYITASNDEDGVSLAINKFILAE